jgi:predicted phosphoribosyltransferase
MSRYRDRADAGRVLAEALRAYAGRDDLLVLALPRGGVPVACEVAKALGAQLDVMVVRKLGVPWQPELAMGAIASGDVLVVNRELVDALNVAESDLHDAASRERQVLHRREELYRDAWPAADIHSRLVILVDDGLATGSTMRAAIAAVRQQEPAKLIAAFPTAPPSACRALATEVDEVVCPYTPEVFLAISEAYDQFPQVSDDEVQRLLTETRQAFERRQADRRRSVAASSRAAEPHVRGKI